MTVLRTSNAPIGLDRGKPITTSDNLGWVKPSDWLDYTVPAASDQKVIGTVAVFNQDSNYFAVNITTTDASNYTVDWGDGTSANFASGVTAEKNYTWASISSGTLTSEGYRQAIVTITPTTAGRTFSNLQLNRRHSALTASTTIFSPWLSLSISAPNATSITLAGSPDATKVVTGLAQQIQIFSSIFVIMENVFLFVKKSCSCGKISFKYLPLFSNSKPSSKTKEIFGEVPIAINKVLHSIRSPALVLMAQT